MRSYKKWLYIFVILCTSFTGCHMAQQGISKLGYQRIADANAQIELVKQKAADDLKTLQLQLDQRLDDQIRIMGSKLQGASNELFASHYAFTLNKAPTRNSLVVDTHVRTAQEYIKLPPTQDAIQKTLDQVTKELDETKTTVQDLQQQFDIEKKRADDLEQQNKNAISAVDAIKKEKEDVSTKSTADINKIQTAKDKATTDLLNKQQDDIANAKNREALIQKLMYWTGALAVAALIAAIYIPLMRNEAAAVAVILGGVTIALPFVEAWMIAVGGSLAILGIIGWIIYKHNNQLNIKQDIIDTETKVNKNLVNAIEDVKTKAKDVYDEHIKPALTEWNTKVVRAVDGTITKVKDNDVISAIDDKLIASDRK